MFQDHPRGCGEHLSILLLWLFCNGSSPRMRGALIGAYELTQPVGIIPADAGSTDKLGRPIIKPGDHPRGCGEHLLEYPFEVPTPGSSPRMRGARLSSREKDDFIRIIPADAGSTCMFPSAHAVSEDHPRGCGEHMAGNSSAGLAGGSSPRMRGAPVKRPYLSGLNRDHPRGCGEH